MDDISIEDFERMVQWCADKELNPEQSPFDMPIEDVADDDTSEDELVKFVERFLVEHPATRHD